MRPEAKKYLWDAHEAARLIRRFVADKSFADYQGDDMLRSAVERQFEIIGEALNLMSKIDAAVAADIPELGRIVAFRNVLIHGYATVDDRLVWGIVEGKLPLLDAACEKLLADN
jgi:uncharacterized protein with HEPN domain